MNIRESARDLDVGNYYCCLNEFLCGFVHVFAFVFDSNQKKFVFNYSHSIFRQS